MRVRLPRRVGVSGQGGGAGALPSAIGVGFPSESASGGGTGWVDGWEESENTRRNRKEGDSLSAYGTPCHKVWKEDW